MEPWGTEPLFRYYLDVYTIYYVWSPLTFGPESSLFEFLKCSRENPMRPVDSDCTRSACLHTSFCWDQCLKSVFPAGSYWFHHLLAAESPDTRTLTTCDTFTLWKAKKAARKSPKESTSLSESGVHFSCVDRGLCVDIYLTCHVIAVHAKQPGHPCSRLQGHVWTPCHTYTALIHLCNNCSDLWEFSLPCFKI